MKLQVYLANFHSEFSIHEHQKPKTSDFRNKARKTLLKHVQCNELRYKKFFLTFHMLQDLDYPLAWAKSAATMHLCGEHRLINSSWKSIQLGWH